MDRATFAVYVSTAVVPRAAINCSSFNETYLTLEQRHTEISTHVSIVWCILASGAVVCVCIVLRDYLPRNCLIISGIMPVGVIDRNDWA